MRLLFLLVPFLGARALDLYRECGKLFNPNSYMAHLPSLSLPYLSDVQIPNNQDQIKPSPVIPTKVINVVTKYVYKNPVCVKVSGKKSACQSLTNKNKMEYLVTKEYFVKNRKSRQNAIENDAEFEQEIISVESSEEAHKFADNKKPQKTPTLSREKVKEMLIEDRLDQLETILPHYTRRRVYETSTITVTKVRSNNRATATLLVKNCIPQGYDLCPPKVKKRKSKVAQITDSEVGDDSLARDVTGESGLAYWYMCIVVLTLMATL